MFVKNNSMSQPNLTFALPPALLATNASMSIQSSCDASNFFVRFRVPLGLPLLFQMTLPAR